MRQKTDGNSKNKQASIQKRRGNKAAAKMQWIKAPQLNKCCTEAKTHATGLIILRTIIPEGVNAIQATGGWEELTLHVDSCASETVVERERERL